MKQIYIKNYKGFDEEVIGLKDVNFLVGENSTGKTSILKLINIINSRDFWFSMEFNNNEVELGYFDEILNKNSSEIFFRIGIEIPSEEKRNSNVTGYYNERVLFEFRESKSVPKLYQIKYQSGELDLLIQPSEKLLKYKSKPILDSTFLEWANDFDFPKNYKKIVTQSYELPVFLYFTLIENKINSNKNIGYQKFLSGSTLYKNYLWLAPIRAKAKRIYESYAVKYSPEGEHIPSLIRNLLSNASKKDQKVTIKVLEKFGKESNLFDEIIVKNLGSKNVSPFEILIRYNNTEIKLPNVGYGVSQSLPIIIEILSSKNHTFSIQQPEVHLHPKAQSALGSFLFNAAVKDNNKFIIETHSDFTINRFRHGLYKSSKSNISSQVLFFNRRKDNNSITNIEIGSKGSFTDGVPAEYRDFFIDEELKLLEL